MQIDYRVMTIIMYYSSSPRMTTPDVVAARDRSIDRMMD